MGETMRKLNERQLALLVYIARSGHVTMKRIRKGNYSPLSVNALMRRGLISSESVYGGPASGYFERFMVTDKGLRQLVRLGREGA
jgi:hypothetical protein